MFSRHMQEELKETAGEEYGEDVPLKESHSEGKEPIMGAAIPAETVKSEQPEAQRKTLLPLDGGDDMSDIDRSSDIESEDSATVDFVISGFIVMMMVIVDLVDTESSYDYRCVLTHCMP